MVESNKTTSLSSSVKLSHFGELFGKIEAEQVCPKCHSYFVSKDSCESCGVQFNHDYLGEPGGHRSFYVMKEDYEDQCPLLWSYYPYKVKARYAFFRRYERRLLKRLKDLVSAFDSQTLIKAQNRSFFILECRHIIEEYHNLQAPIKDLALCLKHLSKEVSLKVLREDVQDMMSEAHQEVIVEKSSGINHQFILSLVTLTFAVVTFFYILFRFLMVSGS